MIIEYFKNIINKKNENNSCDKCWHFIYARKDYANLIGSDDEFKCCVLFILEWFKLKVIKDKDFDVLSRQYDFRAFVGVHSDFTKQYNNEVQNDDEQGGKYELYIKVVMDCLINNLEDKCNRELYSNLGNWSFEPKINNYDVNIDGGYLTGTVIFGTEYGT